jgi:ankyrin repeat protein
MRAARAGRLDLLQMLESAGADLARVDAQGWTPLDHARRKKHWPVVDYLEARRPGESASSTRPASHSLD